MALLLASGVTWFVLDDTTNEPPTTANSATFFVHPLAETTAETVDDWAAAADVVVNAEVVDEQRLEPPRSETATGDGVDLVGRSVTLRVTDVIWRSPAAAQPNPERFTMNAFGWAQANDGSAQEVAAEGAPRLEVGHEYVVPLRWREAECSPGDPTVPAHWSVLSSRAILPADDGRIGVGEYEGSIVDFAGTRGSAPERASTALIKFAGGKPMDIGPALVKAEKQAPERQAAPKSACE